ncbi:ArnT family glycosyltransferase [Mucilaginibacter lacusdianchii]|uniref:ArnT family glycosyltransferase n=1 Tax=Mucilaginibacter lacusdianchii TaxID=2684211 RepID=UPI00131C8C0F|nr:glycosyltransferase family 39 protein [Mucilaginibacter sp. JXJ CY 39]
MGNYLPKLFVAADRRLLIVIVLCAITFFLNLGKAPIYILDEAKNAQCAREMLQKHNWVVPTFNQTLRTDKPPLHYFFMSAAYTIFGVNPFAARFFSAICGLLIVVLTYRFAAKHINKQVGFISALILLGSWQTGLEMRMAVPDPYLILLMMLALYKAYDFYNSSYTKTSRIIIFYICLGLGMLSKGPVAILLPLLIILIFLAAQKQLNIKTFAQFKFGYGLLIIAAISLPWYFLVHQQTHGEWTREFFFTQNLRRFVHPKEGHGGFFFVPLLFVLIGMLPTSVFIVQACRQIYHKAKTNTFIRFLSISVLVIAVFFVVSRTKLPNYPMPCYPFLSILLGYYLQQIINANQAIKWQTIVILVIGLAVPVALFILTKTDPTLKTLPTLWIPFLLLPLGIVVALYYQLTAKRYKTRASIFLVLASFIVTGWILHAYAYPKVYNQNPVNRILQLQQRPQQLVSYRMYNAAFNFQLNQPVVRIESPDSLIQYLNAHPKAQIVTREKYLHELDSLPFSVRGAYKDIFEAHTNYVLRYKP